MKLASSKTQRILKNKGRIAKLAWGDAQWLSATDTGVIQRYTLRGSTVYYEKYALTLDEIFLDYWEELK
jgi:hypothetical protein